MASKKEILDRLDKATSQISSLTRTIAFATLGTSFAVLIGERGAELGLTPGERLLLYVACAAALLALLADYLQYVGFYRHTLETFETLERTKAQEADFRKDAFGYRLQQRTFLLKQVFALAGASSAVAALGLGVWRLVG